MSQSRRFRGRLCAYCRVEQSTPGGEHVFARAFLPKHKRNNPIKVPACASCNNEKSKLEQYLATVCLLAANHDDAESNIREFGNARLSQNNKLASELNAAMQEQMEKQLRWRYEAPIALPFDGDKLQELYIYIMKGLYRYHFDPKALGDIESIGRFYMYDEFEDWSKYFRCRGLRCKGNIGDGAFEYIGIRGFQDELFSVWAFRMYGGMITASTKLLKSTSGQIWVGYTRGIDKHSGS